MTNLYTSLEKAKNGSIIPILYNGKSLESKYNPDNEAEKLILEFTNTSHYFIVTGISSGILINKLLEKNPNCFILCIERTIQDINFLKQIPIVKKISQNNNVQFSTYDNILNDLLNTFLPAKYDDFKIIERRAWIQENHDLLALIQQTIKKAIGIISADYSVQVHFGKIWQNNIINNLKLLSKINQDTISFISNFESLLHNLIKTKTAYVIAAGPSLDKKISLLKNESNIFIISTDTAYSSLIKNNIIPDIVISIDGQKVSTNHFSNIKKDKTLFFFDLCANSSASKHIVKNGGKILFFTSGHPLSSLSAFFSKQYCIFPSIFTGSGTVTIAATDLASQLGFSKIKVLGADFGYSNGKCYTKGTYFDTLYNYKSNKLCSSETNYTKLLFRTELIKQNESITITTQILNAYKDSFEKYLYDNNCVFEYKNFEYKIEQKNKPYFHFSLNTFPIEKFIKYILNTNYKELEIPLLPYIAFLRKKNPLLNYDDLVKLAHSNFVRYNNIHE